MGQALLNAALYLNGDVILSAVSRAETVSYTHLDVYKRQVFGYTRNASPGVNV